MDIAVAIFADGIIYGAWLFLVGIGLTLVFGVMKILNVAHGALYAIGAYAAATLVNSSFFGQIEGFAVLLVMLAGAVIAALMLGPFLERVLLRLFYERDEIVLLLVTCSIPDDHIDPRRSAFFMARSILRDIRSGVRAC